MTDVTQNRGTWLERARAFFDVPIRFAWITLLVPTLAALKFAFGAFPYPGYPDYAMAWIMHFVPFATMLVSVQLTYGHLPDRWTPADPSSWSAMPFHALVIGGGSLLGLIVTEPLIVPLAPPGPAALRQEWTEIPRLMFLFSVIGTPVFVRGFFYRDQLAESRARAEHAALAALAAQIQALQARIQPHFLFNSLNTIAGLIVEDPTRAERAVEKLSDVFRYTLDASNEILVPLAGEIETTEGFLDLEMLRFPDRLRVSWHTEPGVGAIAVPPLLLQPLVENAVQHGIAAREEGGHVEVSIRREKDQLQVRVEDDGPGPGGSVHRGAGSALSDLQTRLRLLYAGRAAVTIDRGRLGGYRVTILLPLDGDPSSVRAEKP